MERLYYIASEKGNSGPFSLSELKTKNLSSNTLVWYEGIKEWTEAGKIEDLASIIPPVSPFEISKQKEIITKKVNLQIQKKLLAKAVIKTLVIFIGLFAAIYYICGGYKPEYELWQNLFDIKVYAVKGEAHMVLAKIALFWSFVLSLICFGLLYVFEKKKVKNQISQQPKYKHDKYNITLVLSTIIIISIAIIIIIYLITQ